MPDQIEVRRVPFAEPLGRQLRPTGTTRGTVLSALVHAAVIGGLLWAAGRQHFIDANRGPGDDLGRGGGGGGGGVRAVAVFARLAGAPAPPPVTPPVVQEVTVPAETPTEIPPPVEKPPEEVVAAPPAPPTGAGEGTGAGTGVGPGSGTGTGGGIGSGVGTGFGNDSGPGGGGGTVIPPQLQGMIIPPPDRPRELRGTKVKVTFRINERGEVVDVSVDPPIRDRGYRNEFMDRMRRYTFTPAYTRDGHRAVASQMDIEIRL